MSQLRKLMFLLMHLMKNDQHENVKWWSHFGTSFFRNSRCLKRETQKESKTNRVKKEVKHSFTIWPSFSIPRTHPRETKTYVRAKTWMWMSIAALFTMVNWGINKQSMLLIHNKGTLFSNKKGQHSVLHHNVDEPQMHAKWKQPGANAVGRNLYVFWQMRRPLRIGPELSGHGKEESRAELSSCQATNV